MTSNTQPKLLPCPFCGSPGTEAYLEEYGNYLVECQACRARGPACDECDEAEVAWNKRKPARENALRLLGTELVFEEGPTVGIITDETESEIFVESAVYTGWISKPLFFESVGVGPSNED